MPSMEVQVAELTADMRRVKTDLYGADGESGVVNEFRAAAAVKQSADDRHNRNVRFWGFVIAAIPIVIEILKDAHLLPH